MREKGEDVPNCGQLLIIHMLLVYFPLAKPGFRHVASIFFPFCTFPRFPLNHPFKNLDSFAKYLYNNFVPGSAPILLE